jgi:lipopolysaccharide transport system ATP-binding protein
MNPNILIDLNNIGVCYRTGKGLSSKHTKKEIWALKDISLTLRKGEKLGVIGRNGCGKSTLMRVLAGIYSIDKGTANFKDNLHVQLLSLSVGFEGNLSGRENAILNGMLMGKSRKHMLSRVEAIKEFSELGDFFEMPVYTYSSGMNARLGFSVAMETDPDVLLIDEVLGVGDASFAEKSAAALKEKFTGEQTLVLISHDPNTITRLCTQAVWIEQGITKCEGEVRTVADKYMQHFY